jgi:hypothetical protein
VESAGGSVADWPAVTDADVGTIQVAPSRFGKIMVLRGLEKAWGNWPKWDQKDGDAEHKLRGLGDALLKRIDQLKSDLAAAPGEEGGEIVVADAPEIGQIQAGSYIPNDPFRWVRGPFPY